nr:hypothetical protein [Pseudomonas fluorescens]
MSLKSPVFTEAQVDAALAQAAVLIFHPQLFRPMPKITLGEVGVPSQTEPPADDWSGKIASSFVRLPVFADFIQRCAADAHKALAKDDPKANPAGLKAGEMCSSPHAQTVLACVRNQLVENPHDAKWIGVVVFALLRTLEETIVNATTSGDTSDMSFAVSMMNSSLVAGDAWELGFVTKRTFTVPQIESSLRKHISERVVIALASMVAVDPGAAFFNERAPVRLH